MAKAALPGPGLPLFPTQAWCWQETTLQGQLSLGLPSAKKDLHPSHLCRGPTALQCCPHLPVRTGEDIQVHVGCVSCVWNGAMTPSQVFGAKHPLCGFQSDHMVGAGQAGSPGPCVWVPV